MLSPYRCAKNVIENIMSAFISTGINKLIANFQASTCIQLGAESVPSRMRALIIGGIGSI